MSEQDARRRRGGLAARAAGAATGLGLAVALLGTTNAYFAGETDTGPESWAAGEVTITDDEAAALFSATNIAPGYSETQSVTVTNASTIDDPNQVEVRLYTEGLIADEESMAAAMTVTVERDDVQIYTGTLWDMPDDWATAPDPGWLSAGGTGTPPTAVYDFVVSFPDTGTDQSSLENESVDLTFVWEARSTGVDHS